MENAQFFHYKTQPTILHKIPAWIKIILILVLAFVAFYLPVSVCLIVYPLLLLFSAIVLKFSFSEIYSDAKPTIAYVVLLYVATILLNLATHFSNLEYPVAHWSDVYTGMSRIFIPNLTYLPLLAHLALSLEITSLVYRTTSHGRSSKTDFRQSKRSSREKKPRPSQTRSRSRFLLSRAYRHSGTGSRARGFPVVAGILSKKHSCSFQNSFMSPCVKDMKNHLQFRTEVCNIFSKLGGDYEMSLLRKP